MSVAETFHGYIETTQDSLLILEACRRNLLPTVSRRLQEKERKLVRSGSVFVFDEKSSGIKRWTDGLVWSPSRILGNFLIYRELEKRIPKRKQLSMDAGARNRRRSNGVADHPHQLNTGSNMKHKERQLVGSLSDSYNFKDDGLIKKTMSLIVDGSPLHLISYYYPDDVVAQKFRTPSKVPELVNLEISPELLVKQNFRIPPMIEPDQYSQPSPYYPTTPTTCFSAAAGQLAKSVPSSSTTTRSLSLPSTDYMHQPMYTRHNSISQFHHPASSFPSTDYQQQNRLASTTSLLDPPSSHHQHRGSLQLDRSSAKSLIFDPMYNITSYNNTLPSPTSSSPTTPLPVSVLPPNELCTNTSSPLSSSSSSSSSFDYSHLQQHHHAHKPVTEHHGRILNLPTLPRQDHTSITSLLTNESPTHHPEQETQQPQYYSHHHPAALHHPDSHAAIYPDYYHGTTNSTTTTHEQQKHHGTIDRLYSLDDSAMQWI